MVTGTIKHLHEQMRGSAEGWLAGCLLWRVSLIQKCPGLPRLLKAPLGALVQALCIAGKLWQLRAAELLRLHHLLLAQLILADSCSAHADTHRDWQQDAVCSCLEFACTTCCPSDNHGFSMQNPGAGVQASGMWHSHHAEQHAQGTETCAGTDTQSAPCTWWHMQTPPASSWTPPPEPRAFR